MSREIIEFKAFKDEWLPQHPEFRIASNAQFLGWYNGTDIQSPDYQCGVIIPLE